jgi:type 1 glutamine amidotransferase
MDKLVAVISTLLLLTGSFECRTSSEEESDHPKVLIFTKTEGFRHASIPDGVRALREIGQDKSYEVIHTENARRFNIDTLAAYDAVVFLNTTGDVLSESQQNAFKAFITDGGGFMGIHSATDTEYEWPWYNELVGAYFKGHPEVQQATVQVINRDHPSTGHLPEKWVRTDEWYNFKNIQDHIQVLANLDESTYEGGTNGENHPIAWYHDKFGGRVFYTGGGHTADSYSETAFRDHLAGGLRYVLEDS